MPETREGLQALGAELLATLGPTGLTERTLYQVGWVPGVNVALEGVRHERVLEAIRALGPTMFVYIDVGRTTREERLRREGRLAGRLVEVEAHSTEVEVEHLLRPQADQIIDGTRSLNEIAADVAARVEGAL
jgi:thymidylate kinase